MLSISEPGPADYGKLILLSAIWGSTFFAIEYALVDFSPLGVAGLRIVIGAVTLAPIIFIKRLPLPRSLRHWRLIFLAGFLYSALPFTLISWGQQFISSGTTAIALAFGPLIALIIAHKFTVDEKLTLQKLAGVVVGLTGVIVLIGLDALDGNRNAVLGQLAVIGAVSCYVCASLVTRRLGDFHSLVLSTTTLGTAALYMLPALFLLNTPITGAGTQALTAIVFLGIVPTALAYVLRVQIVLKVGATFLSQVSYLIPLFALFWGRLFLDETPATNAWIALLLILAGMAITRLPSKR